MNASERKNEMKAYFQNAPDGAWITAYKLSKATGLTLEEATEFLEEKTREGRVMRNLAIRCPECGFLVSKALNREDISDGETWCYNCDAHFNAKHSYNSTDVIYNVSELSALCYYRENIF